MNTRPLRAVAVFPVFGANQRETHPAFFAITSSAPSRTSSMSSDSFSRLHKGNDFFCMKAIPAQQCVLCARFEIGRNSDRRKHPASATVGQPS
jgi:hypothetical protein